MRYFWSCRKGAANINLVTGAHYVPQIVQALDMAGEKEMDLPIVYNSSGYEKLETLKFLEGYVDVYLPDMKYMESSLHKKSPMRPITRKQRKQLLEKWCVRLVNVNSVSDGYIRKRNQSAI